MPWWYELVVAAEHPGPLPATAGGFSFHVEHGLEALADADTIVVPGWHGEPSAAVVRAVRASRRAARLDLQRRVPARRRRRARRARGGDALALRGEARRALPDGEGQRRRALRRRRRRADVSGQRGRDRPLPARRAARPRRRGGQRGRAPARDPAAPRRRPGAADRPADAGASGRRPDRARDGVGARAPAPAARPGDAGRRART